MRVDSVLEKVVVQIPNEFPMIKEIKLFGSYAKGKNCASSDVDLLILTEESIQDRQLRALIRERVDSIGTEFGLETDTVFYSKELYKNDDSRFTRELRDSSRTIYRR